MSYQLNCFLFLCTDFTARILRGIRIAARLDFRFTKEIALSLKELSFSVRRLDKVTKTESSPL